MCNNSKRNVLKKRSLFAINDNDCFKQWSQIVGLKRCGGKYDGQFLLNCLYSICFILENKILKIQ